MTTETKKSWQEIAEDNVIKCLRHYKTNPRAYDNCRGTCRYSVASTGAMCAFALCVPENLRCLLRETQMADYQLIHFPEIAEALGVPNNSKAKKFYCGLQSWHDGKQNSHYLKHLAWDNGLFQDPERRAVFEDELDSFSWFEADREVANANVSTT